MHIWDSKKGYFSVPYTRYAYERSLNGESKTIYGDRVTKVYKFRRDDTSLFETDVPETTRTLIDLYGTSDDASDGHRILTYDIEVEMDSGLPDVKKSENTITAISLHDSISAQYWVLILDESGKLSERVVGDTIVIPFRSEEEMLLKYLDLYEEINPSIVTGWNIDFFDTPYLYNRLIRLFGEKVANRLSPIGLISWSPYHKRYTVAGVSYLDYIELYKNYTLGELPNWRLNTICMIELGRGKVEYTGNLDELFRDNIDKFIEYSLTDTELVVSLDKKLKFIDLARDLCTIGHVPYEEFRYSSKVIEGALLTYLRHRNLVAPNKPAEGREMMEELSESGEKGFTGAYVKEPIPGKYDWVYDLDLKGLYPSIMMSLNISPETKIGKIENWDAVAFLSASPDTIYNFGSDTITKDKLYQMLTVEKYSIASNGVIYRTDVVGCIPDILNTWFNQRDEYRKLEKQYGMAGDTEKYDFYHQRQSVQKVLVNSFYGVVGLPIFRLFDVDNAEAVTTSGKTVIKSSTEMASLKYAKEIGPDSTVTLDDKGRPDYVIYIDTDSCFLSAIPILNHRYGDDWKNKPDDEIIKLVDDIAGEVQNYLNSFYDILAEKIFNISKDKHKFIIKKEFIARSGLWIKKKRYAQWIVAENGIPRDKLDVKGLDSKRSDFPLSFRNVMSEVLISILKGKSEDFITDLIAEFKGNLGSLPIDEIAKNSSVKDMTKYMPKGRSPFSIMKGTPAHVKSAIRYNDCLKHYNCAFKYAPIRDGDKIKWVYIKTNPMGMEALAFKGDIDPIEIMDFINTYVDREKIFESELTDKLQDFYTAVGWGNCLSQKKQASKFFEF